MKFVRQLSKCTLKLVTIILLKRRMKVKVKKGPVRSHKRAMKMRRRIIWEVASVATRSVRRLKKIWSMMIINSRCLQSSRSISCRDGGIQGTRKAELKSKREMIPRRNRMKVTTIIMLMDHPLMKKRKIYPTNMTTMTTNIMMMKTLFAATTKITSTSTKTSSLKRS